jgi:phosphoglycerate dehydrogenase-like enzyme
VDPLVHQIFSPAGLTEMLAQSDYVVMSTPLTDETRGMIGERELQAMKPDAVVINLGRGPVIDEAALVRALAGKHIKGAALDVFDTEPLPGGHAFYGLENVLLSPHCADHTPDWTEQGMRFFLAQFERFSQGKGLENVVEKKQGY